MHSNIMLWYKSSAAGIIIVMIGGVRGMHVVCRNLPQLTTAHIHCMLSRMWDMPHS